MQYTLKPAARLTLAAAALALAAAVLAPAPAFAKTKHTRKMHTKTHTRTHAKKHMTLHRTMHSPRSSAAHPMAPTPTPGHVFPGVRNSVGDAGGSATPPSPSSVNSERGR